MAWLTGSVGHGFVVSAASTAGFCTGFTLCGDSGIITSRWRVGEANSRHVNDGAGFAGDWLIVITCARFGALGVTATPAMAVGDGFAGDFSATAALLGAVDGGVDRSVVTSTRFGCFFTDIGGFTTAGGDRTVDGSDKVSTCTRFGVLAPPATEACVPGCDGGEVKVAD